MIPQLRFGNYMSRESNKSKERLNLTIPATYENSGDLRRTCTAMYKNLGVTHQGRGAPAYLAVMSPELRDVGGKLLATGKSEIMGELRERSQVAWAGGGTPTPQVV